MSGRDVSDKLRSVEWQGIAALVSILLTLIGILLPLWHGTDLLILRSTPTESLPTPTATVTSTPTPTARLKPTQTSTPTPTETPAPTSTPTPTLTATLPLKPDPTPVAATPVYPLPELIGVEIRGCTVNLMWSWPWLLLEDEYFAVRVGIGGPGESKTWTKAQACGLILTEPGDYVWRVVICRGDPETHACEELAVSEQGQFSFQGCSMDRP